jgi:hypothetical protein
MGEFKYVRIFVFALRIRCDNTDRAGRAPSSRLPLGAHKYSGAMCSWRTRTSMACVHPFALWKSDADAQDVSLDVKQPAPQAVLGPL